ncbi:MULTISPECIES: hypothetical protein [Kingella]|uniref:Uncharacterized protein n=1 Tax=Kingella oralis ATCC 51147 TaxID=629741 RepID=C4GGG4_9NEIS|nr:MULTISPECIES: hypothetical protein [Kingella]EEP69319.1 hypothetical protein GCWU000324_01232 [Kingella oralis ATCC 51147]QMT43861.1 hypothetical protein H3L93_05965 [Kingella oralis]DAK23303.1 MAG TPA: hypothetical protein [Caudoviricetes sp.]DAL03226.1 MAG TPA: hypothetical protein [Caudoviricetes sp.]
MSKNRTSIYERLRKSKNRQTRLDFAHEWADKWEQDYITLIERLKRAVAAQDEERIAELFGDLGGLNRPKFTALHNVIDELDTPTRELED